MTIQTCIVASMPRLRAFLRERRASSLLEFALVVPMLLLLLVGAIDFGHGFYLAIEVSSAAQAAAMYGVQNPTDTTGLSNLAKLNAQDVKSLSVTAVSGCECSDGTGTNTDCSRSVVCSTNVVRYMDVTVTGIFLPILSFPGINTDITLRAHQKMRSAT